MKTAIVLNSHKFIESHFGPYLTSIAEKKPDTHVLLIDGSGDPRDMLALSGLPLESLNGVRGSARSLLRVAYTFGRYLSKNKVGKVELIGMQPILFFGLVCCLFPKLKVILYVSGLGAIFSDSRDAAPSPLKFLARVLFRTIIILRANGVIVENNQDLFTIRNLTKWRKVQLLKINGAGCDVRSFTSGQLKERRQLNEWRIGYTGRLLKDKGLEELVEAFYELRKKNSAQKISLRIAGARDPANPMSLSADEIRQFCARGVVFEGQIEHVNSFLDELDVFVFPSYREGMPKSLIEAKCSGIPTITTDVAGCRDVENLCPSGLIVPSKSKKHIVEALEIMMTDKKRHRETALLHAATAKDIFCQDKIARIHSDFVNTI